MRELLTMLEELSNFQLPVYEINYYIIGIPIILLLVPFVYIFIVMEKWMKMGYREYSFHLKYDLMIPTANLKFGILRPQSWWDEHPDHRKVYEGIRESIKNKGLQKPLEVYLTSIVDVTKVSFCVPQPKEYVVEIGNQRLKALLELGITEAPCVWFKK